MKKRFMALLLALLLALMPAACAGEVQPSTRIIATAQMAAAMAKDKEAEIIASGSRDTDQSAQIAAGNEDFRAANYEEACTHYKLFVEQYPAQWQGYNNLALALLHLDDAEGALKNALTGYYVGDVPNAEPLINALVAAHTLELSPRTLFEMINQVDTSGTEESLAGRYDEAMVTEFIRAMCYNVAYMQMEQSVTPVDGAGAPIETASDMIKPDAGLQEMLDYLKSIAEGHEDAMMLVDYLSGLIKNR